MYFGKSDSLLYGGYALARESFTRKNKALQRRIAGALEV
jgi:hypothetical protein